MSDHTQPYAPWTTNTVVFLADPATVHDERSFWGTYWRRRDFNSRRHANPFPRIHLFRRSARA